MDVSKIDDLKELKSMAYDFLRQKQICEQNIVTIRERIHQLETKPPEEDTGNKKEKS